MTSPQAEPPAQALGESLAALAVQFGSALDFWRVEAIEPGALLRLRAEMKLPGLA